MLPLLKVVTVVAVLPLLKVVTVVAVLPLLKVVTVVAVPTRRYAWHGKVRASS